MRRLRVLITNNTLAERAGSELWVRDLATALLARGHAPIAFSTPIGAAVGSFLLFLLRKMVPAETAESRR